jgi:PPOX class probable F420-dependent enzyme
MPALPESAIAVLNHPQAYAHIITLNRDGSPHITLVWVETIDGVPSFNTERGRQKVANLERDPRIAISVQNPENTAEYLVIEGRGRLLPGNWDEQIHRLSQRYMGRDFAALGPDVQRVRVDVEIERISGTGPWVGE